MGFATLAELKSQLNIPAADVSNDTELQIYLDASNDVVETMVGPSAVTTFTERYSTVNGSIITMRRPLVAVTSVTPDGGAALAATAYIVDTVRGGLEIKNRLPGDYTIVYTAGWSAIPPRGKLAQLIIGQHLWRTQRGGMVASVVADEGLTPVPGVGFAIPNRAAELLQSLNSPHTVPGIA